MGEVDTAEAVMGNLMAALRMLENCPEFAFLIPEVRVNIAYALPGATSPRDVAAVEGRVTVAGGFPRVAAWPAWGASDHLARRLIEVRKYAPEINAVINFRCDDEIIEFVRGYCSDKGLLLGWLDRSREPERVTEKDGASMPWKVKQIFDKYGAMPRLFYEGAGWGKEPLFLALGGDAVEVAETAIEIARLYSRKMKKRA